ncbi:hypothetical protein ISN45_At01g002090 [Arabidopsis thaliana x Arabidopsis arenosa]|uniref:Uncharacterized protein n=1 Tax=Arabidopsis thaliana x Arabidopsis arenosa TaxID=1240361 RepID=A0A8T2GHR1_9BRAS|nr:hypothetical protein ISN45_At01g002090 [Arabidopsis thaliana x Arabidopsis arenosa]
MWRRRNLPGNPDSDQSISEEEEEIINVSLGENDMWPSENAKEEEGGLILQTKLEKLIGCGALNYARDPGDVTVEATEMPKIYQKKSWLRIKSLSPQLAPESAEPN